MESAELDRLHHDGAITDATRRRIQRSLDLEHTGLGEDPEPPLMLRPQTECSKPTNLYAVADLELNCQGGGSNMAGSETAKVTALGWVVVGAGLLAYGSSFLPWHTTNVSVLSIDRSTSQDAWHAGTGAWLSVLLLVVASVSVLVSTSVPLGRTAAGALITLGASVLGLVTLVLRWVTFPDAGGGLDKPIRLGDLGELDLSGAYTVSSGAGAGLYLGLIAAIAAVVASLVTFHAAGRN